MSNPKPPVSTDTFEKLTKSTVTSMWEKKLGENCNPADYNCQPMSGQCAPYYMKNEKNEPTPTPKIK